ncbi:MAG: hypothetical protein A4E30_00482 [Methanomassiliicoccales archaeon PtaB.Bin215]|nr:MAG: hypothetical protein A4E30_00482 [Methanomassiliicoccales archaeon PtaB.Bin215]
MSLLRTDATSSSMSYLVTMPTMRSPETTGMVDMFLSTMVLMALVRLSSAVSVMGESCMTERTSSSTGLLFPAMSLRPWFWVPEPLQEYCTMSFIPIIPTSLS